MSETKTERKARPPKGQSRADERPERSYSPIGDFRGKLAVGGKDGEWMYRWFHEKSSGGQRIMNAQLAGWDLVDITKEEHLQVGEEHIEKSSLYGSLIRKPSGTEGTWLYLMRMPLWAYEDVQKQKQTRVDDVEADLFREHTGHDGDPEGEDLYGKNKIGHGTRPRSSIAD